MNSEMLDELKDQPFVFTAMFNTMVVTNYSQKTLVRYVNILTWDDDCWIGQNEQSCSLFCCDKFSACHIDKRDSYLRLLLL